MLCPSRLLSRLRPSEETARALSFDGRRRSKRRFGLPTYIMESPFSDKKKDLKKSKTRGFL